MVARETPKVSYCTTCKGRLHHLMQTLPANMNAERDNPNVEFVVLDYGSDDGLAEWIHTNFMNEIESGKLVYARTEQPHFRMAHAKNMAHRLASGDILCNLDADNFIAPNFSVWLREQYHQTPHGVCRIQPISTKELLLRKVKVFVHGKSKMLPAMGGGSGRIAVDQHTFNFLGGYDESFKGWGCEDTQFLLRARDAGIASHVIPPERFGRVIKHNHEQRLENYEPSAIQRSVKLLARSKRETNLHSIKAFRQSYRPQANTDGMGCGDVRLNFSDESTTLHPLEQGISTTFGTAPEARRTDWSLGVKRPNDIALGR